MTVTARLGIRLSAGVVKVMRPWRIKGMNNPLARQQRAWAKVATAV